MNKALIVHDDAGIKKILSEPLKEAGYEVLDVQSVNEGIKAFIQNPCDLIITGIMLKGKNGLELVVEIRKEFPKAKIIVVSENEKEMGILPAAMRLGADAGISCPIDGNELIKLIRNIS